MPRRVFRVCRSIYARLDGEGARRVGGRWNSIGHPVVYMAESIALAVLENLVHNDALGFPARLYCRGRFNSRAATDAYRGRIAAPTREPEF